MSIRWRRHRALGWLAVAVASATLGGPGVIPTQSVVSRWAGEDAVDEQGVGVRGVDANAVAGGDIFYAASVRRALLFDVFGQPYEGVRALAVKT